MPETVTIDEDTKFCPSDWMDEFAPCLVASPDELLTLTDAGWIIEDKEDDDPEKSTRMALVDGQIVPFSAYRGYGSCYLTVETDGTYDGDWPEDTTHFSLWDADDLDFFSTIDELIDHYAAQGKPLTPGDHEIECWYWSETDVNFRFDIVDGKGRFSRVEASDVH